ncbi:MAG: YbhB/YbcL family Raf kinase inhibitor-like protein [Gemmatimonadota bacterium]|nr:YbhB/YbcL family Raf kinase inhibitor-like protein [Gemmatimonadota bacterium]
MIAASRTLRAAIIALSVSTTSTLLSAQGVFTLTSTDVKTGATIPNHQVFNGMGCTGDNVSPQLAWKGAPAGTKSFAVTVYDPDAPTGSGWWHWMVYNLPASTTSLPAGAGGRTTKLMPAGGVQGPTDFGVAAWGGPCPPVGDKAHHYVFTVYALKTDHLDIPAGASSAMLGFNLHGNMLAKASFTALYGR